MLIDLARENRSLVVVTHNMAFAQKVANKIIFLDEGRVAFDGPAGDFFASDQPRIRQFLNIFDVVSSAS